MSQALLKLYKISALIKPSGISAEFKSSTGESKLKKLH